MNMEKFMQSIAKTQEFEPNDRLSALISKYSNDEISEEELFMVSAANKPEFKSFISDIKTNKE